MQIREVDFIRYLIDYIDSKVKETTPVVVIQNSDNDCDDSEYVDPDEVECAMDRDDVFIPPLQAKIEMMKKMTSRLTVKGVHHG